MAWDNYEMDDEVLYVNGLTWDNSASSIMKRDDKVLYNNQLDEELGLYEYEQYAKFWTTRLSTINLTRVTTRFDDSAYATIYSTQQ